MMTPARTLPILRRLHERIRDAVVEACEAQAVEEMAAIAHDGAGDTIYAVDRVSEELLVDVIEAEIASCETRVVLVSEGLDTGEVVLPRDVAAAAQARGESPPDPPPAGAPAPEEFRQGIPPVGAPAPGEFRQGIPPVGALRIIFDPIDGTRGLMYQKRSAWILTGVAPDLGEGTGLGDIEVALMTEIPLVKQHQSDVLWAVRGQGARGERHDRLRGSTRPLALKPSTAAGIAHGFAQISRFFPGARAELAAVDDAICRRVLGPIQPGKAQCFEDQYISTGGQLYEVVIGHDRFVADLRPLMEPLLAARGGQSGICCHPYDLCTELIAREAGAVVCAPDGQPLSAPLAVEPDVAWAAYANDAIRAQVEPALHAALHEIGIRI